MGALAWVTGIIVAVGFVAAGGAKLTKQAMVVQTAERLNYTNLLMPLGAAEVAGGIGVFLGLLSDGLEFVGFLAAIGLIAAMIGAVVYHRRAGDPPKEMAPAAVLGVLTVLYLIGLMGN